MQPLSDRLTLGRAHAAAARAVAEARFIEAEMVEHRYSVAAFLTRAGVGAHVVAPFLRALGAEGQNLSTLAARVDAWFRYAGMYPTDEFLEENCRVVEHALEDLKAARRRYLEAFPPPQCEDDAVAMVVAFRLSRGDRLEDSYNVEPCWSCRHFVLPPASHYR